MLDECVDIVIGRPFAAEQEWPGIDTRLAVRINVGVIDEIAGHQVEGARRVIGVLIAFAVRTWTTISGKILAFELMKMVY